MELDKQEGYKPQRDAHGRLLPGYSGNLNGRPKGQSLKEFAREMLASMPIEEKKEFIAKLPADIVWRMAEGNPHQSEDLQVTQLPTPLDDVHKDDGIQEDKGAEEEN